MGGDWQVTIRQKLTWTFLLGAPLVFALVVCQCSCSSPPKWPTELPPVPQAKSQFEIAAQRGYYFDGGTVSNIDFGTLWPDGSITFAHQTNLTSLIPWRYPTLTNEYKWSLETTTDFKTWQTVTNYPAGFTNDAVVTNAYDSTPHWFRMHGGL